MDQVYNRFLIAVRNNDIALMDEMNGNKKYIELVDMSSALLTYISKAFTEILTDYCYEFADIVNNYDTWDLVIFIILMFLVFIVALGLFLMSFKSSILRAKRMLGIMPTQFVIRELDRVKVVIQQIS